LSDFRLPTGLIFLAAGLHNIPPIGEERVSRSAPWFLIALAVAGVGTLTTQPPASKVGNEASFRKKSACRLSE
jgi:hypothetical protein